MITKQLDNLWDVKFIKPNYFKCVTIGNTIYMNTLNKHTLKDTINRTRIEALDYLSDLNTEKEPIRKAFLQKKYDELAHKYHILTGRKLEPA
jgi:hypothetical protein